MKSIDNMTTDCLEETISEVTDDALFDVRQKRSSKAVEDLSKFIDSGIESVRLYNALASAYLDQDDYSNSILCLEKALEINPDAGFLYANLGGVYADKGDFKNALEYYKEAILFGIEEKLLLPELIKAYTKTGDFEKAQHYSLVQEGLA